MEPIPGMIWRPRPDMRVVLKYRKETRINGLHLAPGIVEIVAKGPGPANALVKLDSGRRVVVPRGNLFFETH